MRSVILVGAAALALGTMMSPAAAGPFWFLGKTISECVHVGVHHNHAAQVQCGYNNVDDDGRSNDDNVQRIKQRQNAQVKHFYLGTLQLQVGKNYVEEGDNNTQKVRQSQSYRGKVAIGTQQLQVGVNSVEDGDNNTQTIKQSQSLSVGGGHHHNNP